MFTKKITILVFTLTIIGWPLLMTTVAWDTANCNLENPKCIRPILLHLLVFGAPIIWLTVALHLIINLRVVVFEENRNYLPANLNRQRNFRFNRLHED